MANSISNIESACNADLIPSSINPEVLSVNNAPEPSAENVDKENFHSDKSEVATELPKLVATNNTAIERFPNNLPKKLGLILAQNNNTYAVIKDAANPSALPVGGRKLNNIIRAEGNVQGFTLRKSDISEINDGLKAHAETARDFQNVWYRVAPIIGGVEIDIGDDAHTRVKVTAGNVELVTEDSETLFFRSAVSLPFVMPAKTGDIKLLKKYLNMHAVSATLFIGWLTYTLSHPKVATSKFVILSLQGGQGTGKTSLCNNIILKLLDPSVVGVQMLPNNIKDLAIAAQNAHVLCFDNMRDIGRFMSDVLCIAATGGAMTSRQLYTDADQQVMNLHVALVLNGIHSFIDQPDLAQRCLPIQLQPIPESSRVSDTELVANFNADLPAIMRGLFELIANIFTNLPNAKVTSPERMIDFVQWLAAMELVDGAPIGTYQSAYSESLNQGQLDAMQDSLLGAAVLEFCQNSLKSLDWSGTPEELLKQLNTHQTQSTLRSRDWPQNAISLSKRLIPLLASLLTQGIHIEFRRGKKRNINIHLLETQHDAHDESHY